MGLPSGSSVFSKSIPSDVEVHGVASRLGRHRRVARAACRALRWAVDAAEAQGLYRLRVGALAAGDDIVMAATDEGLCAVEGAVEGGSLRCAVEWIPLGGLDRPRVSAVATGCFHTLAATDAGDLYTWGVGSFGRLGHGDCNNVESPRRVGHLTAQGARVVSVAAGFGHSAAVSDEGEVFTFGEWYVGDGDGGALGHGIAEIEWDFGWRDVALPRGIDHRKPTRVAALAGKRVCEVACGCSFTVARTRDGDVYTFGYGSDGRLGHGGTRSEFEPLALARLRGATAVAAGAEHVAVVTKRGALFTFGYGGNGQLGHGGEESEWVPRRVDGVPAIVGVSAGTDHTLAVTENGDLFAAGSMGSLRGERSLSFCDVGDIVAAGPIARVVSGGQVALAETRDGGVVAFGGWWCDDGACDVVHALTTCLER